MTRAIVTDISQYLDLTGIYGDYADNYDTDAIRTDYINAVEACARRIIPDLTVTENGQIVVNVEDIETAHAIDWRELVYSIDITPFLEAHDLQQ
jgi:hypothetical protein